MKTHTVCASCAERRWVFHATNKNEDDPELEEKLAENGEGIGKKILIGVAVAGAGVAIAGAGVAVGAAGLAAAGFGSTGIVGGSIAAGVQSSIGNVAAGSMFASLQSAGATGLISSVGSSGLVSGLSGAATSAAAYVASKMRGGKGTDDEQKETAKEVKREPEENTEPESLGTEDDSTIISIADECVWNVCKQCGKDVILPALPPLGVPHEVLLHNRTAVSSE